MKQIHIEIETIVKNELIRSNKKFKDFVNNHEAYAVLLEEVEEMNEAFNNLRYMCDEENIYISELWKATKENKSEKKIKQILNDFYYRLILLSEETIQSGAMCKKWIDMLEKEERNNFKDLI
jgi:hypoxanthine-guanine phosphoribosyltransferase